MLPTTPTVTPRIKEAMENPWLSPENTMFANYYGLPAISVPSGLDKRGLPLGLQIVGRPWDERSVLRLGISISNGERWEQKASARMSQNSLNIGPEKPTSRRSIKLDTDQPQPAFEAK